MSTSTNTIINEHLQKIIPIGKEKYGSGFRYYEQDYEIWSKLIAYCINDADICSKHNINVMKGILLSGPVGCGKTTMIQLLNVILPPFRRYPVHPTRRLVIRFEKEGPLFLESADRKIPICYDDLGADAPVIHYGNKYNVIADLLYSRYELFIKQSIPTHATTNLNSEELKELYGNRVTSRMRSMFNVISFPNNTMDKRQ